MYDNAIVGATAGGDGPSRADIGIAQASLQFTNIGAVQPNYGVQARMSKEGNADQLRDLASGVASALFDKYSDTVFKKADAAAYVEGQQEVQQGKTLKEIEASRPWYAGIFAPDQLAEGAKAQTTANAVIGYTNAMRDYIDNGPGKAATPEEFRQWQANTAQAMMTGDPEADKATLEAFAPVTAKMAEYHMNEHMRLITNQQTSQLLDNISGGMNAIADLHHKVLTGAKDPKEATDQSATLMQQMVDSISKTRPEIQDIAVTQAVKNAYANGQFELGDKMRDAFASVVSPENMVALQNARGAGQNAEWSTMTNTQADALTEAQQRAQNGDMDYVNKLDVQWARRNNVPETEIVSLRMAAWQAANAQAAAKNGDAQIGNALSMGLGAFVSAEDKAKYFDSHYLDMATKGDSKGMGLLVNLAAKNNYVGGGFQTLLSGINKDNLIDKKTGQLDPTAQHALTAFTQMAQQGGLNWALSNVKDDKQRAFLADAYLRYKTNHDLGLSVRQTLGAAVPAMDKDMKSFVSATSAAMGKGWAPFGWADKTVALTPSAQLAVQQYVKDAHARNVTVTPETAAAYLSQHSMTVGGQVIAVPNAPQVMAKLGVDTSNVDNIKAPIMHELSAKGVHADGFTIQHVDSRNGQTVLFVQGTRGGVVTGPAIPLQTSVINDHIQAQYHQTGRAGIFNTVPATQASRSMDKYVITAANNNGVPPALAVAVAHKETGHMQSRPEWGVSPKGAVGLMQVMPINFGGYTTNQMKQPDINSDVGTKVLRQFYNTYNSWPAAVAAYNGGDAAGSAVKAGRWPPAKETQNYLRAIFGPNWQPRQQRTAANHY